ncbi:hypothetical protein BH11PSE8_BH11PSE8_32580 [soil metagenome]
MSFAKIESAYAAALTLAMILTLAVLAGCATPGVVIDGPAQVSASLEAPAPPAERDFPPVAKAQWKQGAFPSIEALRAMNTGMGKDQVRGLLGWPHFKEGLGGDREWNYLFQFRTGIGAEFVTCQYMVRFNGDVLTTGLYWKDPDCARWVNPPGASVAAAAPAAPAAPVVHRVPVSRAALRVAEPAPGKN